MPGIWSAAQQFTRTWYGPAVNSCWASPLDQLHQLGAARRVVVRHRHRRHTAAAIVPASMVTVAGLPSIALGIPPWFPGMVSHTVAHRAGREAVDLGRVVHRGDEQAGRIRERDQVAVDRGRRCTGT